MSPLDTYNKLGIQGVCFYTRYFAQPPVRLHTPLCRHKIGTTCVAGLTCPQGGLISRPAQLPPMFSCHPSSLLFPHPRSLPLSFLPVSVIFSPPLRPRPVHISPPNPPMCTFLYPPRPLHSASASPLARSYPPTLCSLVHQVHPALGRP